MWKKLIELARGENLTSGVASRQAPTGKTTVTVETTREVVTAERLDRAFCAELLGVRSFIDDVNPLEKRVMKRVDRLLGRGSELAGLVPRVSAVIPKLMQSLRDDNVSGNQLAAEISRDAVLLSDVIRFANSAYYRTREPVKSVEQATLMVGRDGLRSLIARAAFKPLLNSQKDHFGSLAGPLLWQQAERCAITCECIAKQEGVPVFEAFVAGLIHKVGYKIVARVLSEEYAGADAPRSAEFRDWLVDRAPALSWRASVEWGLPSTVSEGLKGLVNREDRAEFPAVTGVVLASSKLSELYLLNAAGRIRGDIKRFACRVNGRLVDYCSTCYSQMSRLDESH